MAYLYIFAGSYILFFVVTWLYVLVARYNALQLYRDIGMSEEKVQERIATEEWKSRLMTRRSTLVNGSAFGLLVALVYSLSIYAL